jgi:hypothetical protein
LNDLPTLQWDEVNMTKVIVAKMRSHTAKRRKSAMAKKRVRGPNGQLATVYTVDSTSKTFDGDLVRVFESNVAAAHQANTRIFGSPDGPGES